MTHYTAHFYLNDSAQALGIPAPKVGETDHQLEDTMEKPAEVLRGGATTFHARKGHERIDVDPKAGRVLIFQHQLLRRKLFSIADGSVAYTNLYVFVDSGDDVIAGVK